MPSSSPATAFEAAFASDEHGHGPTCSTVGEAFEELTHDVVAMNYQIGASDWKARVHEGCRQKCLNPNCVRLKSGASIATAEKPVGLARTGRGPGQSGRVTVFHSVDF